MNCRGFVYALLLLACVAPAHADVWTDPSLGEALAKAELVVRARAPKDGSQGTPVVRFRVERTIKGKAPKSIEVGGFHDPTRNAAPSFRPNAEVLLILVRGEDGGWRVPTPTFGRYPIRNGVVKYATLRDTYLRLDLPPGDFERFIRLHEGDVDAAWLKALRAELANGGPGDQGLDLAQRYLALEALALRGKPDDGPRIAPYLSQPAPFQLRISACRALAASVGKAAAGRLLKLATDDPEAAVRTAAIGALGRLRPPPTGMVQRLAAILPGATEDPVRFSGPNDPRLNKWPSPKTALLLVIRRRGPAPVKTELLSLVADYRGSNGDLFAAALRCLVTLKGDRQLPRQLVRCFRAKSEVSAKVYNTEICAALQLITGQRFEDDVDAWRRWAENR